MPCPCPCLPLWFRFRFLAIVFLSVCPSASLSVLFLGVCYSTPPPLTPCYSQFTVKPVARFVLNLFCLCGSFFFFFVFALFWFLHTKFTQKTLTLLAHGASLCCCCCSCWHCCCCCFGRGSSAYRWGVLFGHCLRFLCLVCLFVALAYGFLLTNRTIKSTPG